MRYPEAEELGGSRIAEETAILVAQVDSDRIHSVDVSPRGEVVASLRDGGISIHTPPPHIASQIRQGNFDDPLALPNLQSALWNCMTGSSRPVDVCHTLIRYSYCRVSLAEWYCAHQILIDASAEHESNVSHWFQNLYLALKEVQIQSDEDDLIAKRCLREARDIGVIESIDSILSAMHITNSLEEEVRMVHRTGTFILDQVMRIDTRFGMLQASCERYRKFQLYSQCVGIALQLIPIVGGMTS